MGYRTSNAAYAYDMQPSSNAYAPEREVRGRQGFTVVNGRAREADQETSPAFRHCIKLFCILAALFVAVGMVRVAVAGATSGIMNSNADLVEELEDARDSSSDLEVKYSVYGSSTRIRSLAESYGMVEAEETVTLDFTEYVDADDAAEASSASAAASSASSGEASEPDDIATIVEDTVQ